MLTWTKGHGSLSWVGEEAASIWKVAACLPERGPNPSMPGHPVVPVFPYLQ